MKVVLRLCFLLRPGLLKSYVFLLNESLSEDESYSSPQSSSSITDFSVPIESIPDYCDWLASL